MEAMIEAFEMWSYRGIMRISWKGMKSNAEVLKMIGLKNKELVLSIKKKKLAYYGLVRSHHSLQRRPRWMEKEAEDEEERVGLAKGGR